MPYRCSTGPDLECVRDAKQLAVKELDRHQLNHRHVTQFWLLILLRFQAVDLEMVCELEPKVSSILKDGVLRVSDARWISVSLAESVVEAG